MGTTIRDVQMPNLPAGNSLLLESQIRSTLSILSKSLKWGGEGGVRGSALGQLALCKIEGRPPKGLEAARTDRSGRRSGIARGTHQPDGGREMERAERVGGVISFSNG